MKSARESVQMELQNPRRVQVCREREREIVAEAQTKEKIVVAEDNKYNNGKKNEIYEPGRTGPISGLIKFISFLNVAFFLSIIWY